MFSTIENGLQIYQHHKTLYQTFADNQSLQYNKFLQSKLSEIKLKLPLQP